MKRSLTIVGALTALVMFSCLDAKASGLQKIAVESRNGVHVGVGAGRVGVHVGGVGRAVGVGRAYGGFTRARLATPHHVHYHRNAFVRSRAVFFPRAAIYNTYARPALIANNYYNTPAFLPRQTLTYSAPAPCGVQTLAPQSYQYADEAVDDCQQTPPVTIFRAPRQQYYMPRATGGCCGCNGGGGGQAFGGSAGSYYYN